MGLRQEASLQAKEEPVERHYLTFSGGTGCWCGHISSCGSWQHGDAGEHNSCGRSFCSNVFCGKLVEGRLNDATPQAKHQVQGGFFLDIVV